MHGGEGSGRPVSYSFFACIPIIFLYLKNILKLHFEAIHKLRSHEGKGRDQTCLVKIIKEVIGRG